MTRWRLIHHLTGHYLSINLQRGVSLEVQRNKRSEAWMLGKQIK